MSSNRAALLAPLIKLSLASFEAALNKLPFAFDGRDADLLVSVSEPDLGRYFGVPAGFTDLAVSYMSGRGHSSSRPAPEWRESMKREFLISKLRGAIYGRISGTL